MADSTQPEATEQPPQKGRYGVLDRYQEKVSDFIRKNARLPNTDEIKNTIIPEAVKENREAREKSGKKDDHSLPTEIERETEKFLLENGRRPEKEEKTEIISRAVGKIFPVPKSDSKEIDGDKRDDNSKQNDEKDKTPLIGNSEVLVTAVQNLRNNGTHINGERQDAENVKYQGANHNPSRSNSQEVC